MRLPPQRSTLPAGTRTTREAGAQWQQAGDTGDGHGRAAKGRGRWRQSRRWARGRAPHPPPPWLSARRAARRDAREEGASRGASHRVHGHDANLPSAVRDRHEHPPSSPTPSVSRTPRGAAHARHQSGIYSRHRHDGPRAWMPHRQAPRDTQAHRRARMKAEREVALSAPVRPPCPPHLRTARCASPGCPLAKAPSRKAFGLPQPSLMAEDGNKRNKREAPLAE